MHCTQNLKEDTNDLKILEKKGVEDRNQKFVSLFVCLLSVYCLRGAQLLSNNHKI